MREKTGAIGEILGRTGIRHIQRGCGLMVRTGSGISTSRISLNGFHDEAKMMVIIDGSMVVSGSVGGGSVYLEELSIWDMTLTSYSGADKPSGRFSYQVIEFY